MPPVTVSSVTCDRYECQQVAVCDQQWQWSVHVQCCRVITVFSWLCWPCGCDSNERHHSTTRSVSRHTLTNPGLLSPLISASNSIIYGWLTTVKYSFVENLLQACKDSEVFLIGHIVITYLYIKLRCLTSWIAIEGESSAFVYSSDWVIWSHWIKVSSWRPCSLFLCYALWHLCICCGGSQGLQPCRCTYEHWRQLVEDSTKDAFPLCWLSSNCPGTLHPCNDCIMLWCIRIGCVIIIIILKVASF